MPRSATTAHLKKTKRPSPKKAKATAPKTRKRIAPKKATPPARKRATRAFPKKTRRSPKEAEQISVAAMRARIEALETEKAALKIQVQEGQEQQTATAEVLKVINSSAGDLGPVFRKMIERAVNLCDAAHGALRTFDGELFHIAATSRPAYLLDKLQQLGSVPTSGLFGQLLHEDVVHFEDARETTYYRENVTTREI